MRDRTDFETWTDTVPDAIRRDPLWRVQAYRLALFVGEVSWAHVSRLSADRRTRALSDQLYRAVGSVSANIAEGYSRGGGRDRARFYEYALGSAREARDWYYKARHVLGEDDTAPQIDRLAQITRLLLTMTRDQRTVHLREPDETYDAPN
ncbi:MAG TPA: four helix bundle protein [Bacteroidetes bacterium]|nr:four helix bundle protein [Bacteroidota bacterium]HIL56911.1 four helix bundle protein [Rhodothermales bacterium]